MNQYTLADISKPGSLLRLCEKMEADIAKKKDLANKVMKAKGLTIDEKQEICRLLTTEEAPTVKRGRNSKVKRDKALAMAYLVQKHYKKWTGISQLCEKYDLSGSDTTTFYKAVGRGIVALEKEMEGRIATFEKEFEMLPALKEDKELMRLLGYAKSCLDLIGYHRQVFGKTGKNKAQLNSLE